MHINTRTDIKMGHDWEGVPCEVDFSYVVAEDATGRRWAHFKTFRYDDEAQEFAAKIVAALAEGRALDMDNWTEIEPCYGSAAFQTREAGAGKDRCPDCFDAHRAGVDARCAYHGGEA